MPPKKKNAISQEDILNFQTKVQGFANKIGYEMTQYLDSTDKAMLKLIQSYTAKYNGKTGDLKAEYDALKNLMAEIYDIRKKAIDEAENLMVTEAFGFSDEAQKNAAETIDNAHKKAGNKDKKVKLLPKKKLKQIVDYAPFQGQTISQWFHNWTTSDVNRIVSAVQQASTEKLTVADIVKRIRGTQANNYTDGILQTSRNSANMIARTVINGVANETRKELLDDNMDVIDGQQFLATLDGRTSFICASLDGKIWKKNELDQVKRPPLHPNCRSTLIPYIELHDEDGNVIEDETDRAAAAEDFVQKAKERYEQNHPGKKWDNLAASTRDKYYYDEQKIYDDEHGERGASWNHVPANTTFKEYLENQPEEFQRSWLGERRFELYKAGTLKFEDLVKPDSGYTVTLDELNVNSSNNTNSINNSASNSTTTGYNNSNTTQKGTTPPIPLGRTADELKLTDPILTVDDFKNRFADKQAIYDQENERLLNELDEEIQRIDNDNSLTEQEKKDKKVKEDERIQKLQDDLLDRHRDDIFNTIFPDLKPNSLNRERLATEQMSNERFIPLKPYPSGNPRWYDVKRGCYVTSLPTTAKARTLGAQSDKHKEYFKKGKEFFGQIADSMGYDITGVIDENEFYGIIKRGYHTSELDKKRDNGKNITVLSNKIGTRPPVATVVHEIVHALEDKNPELRRKIAEFYIKNTTLPNGTRSLIKEIPWLRGEYYRESGINLLTYGEYALKYDGSTEGVEMLTHFFTEMVERPEEVIEKCPDWFNGMMNCLKQ